MIGLDAAKTSELTLSARVRLQRDRVEACDIGQIVFKLFDHLNVTLGTLQRHERMQIRDGVE
jgi:hypothetical protein